MKTGHSDMIEIVEAMSGRLLEDFIRLPGRLAKGDPCWVEPLWFERRQFLSSKHNPFFKHAEVKFWVALKDGVPVGRISAQVDHLMTEVNGVPLGFFGLIDARQDDVLHELFITAENWLKTKGVKLVRGPFSMSVNETAGLLVEGADTPPYLLMDHHDPWLGNAVERQGYVKAQDLVAYLLDLRKRLPDRPRRLAERPWPGLVVRSMDNSRYREEIETVTSIFNDAWAGNWGFIPLTEAEVDAMAKDLKPILHPDLVKIAELDGEPVAFIVGLPNINELIADLGGKLFPFGWARLLWRLKVTGVTSGRIPLMGVKSSISDSFIGKALPLRLIYAIEEPSRAHGFDHVELSWLLENNWPVRRVVESLGAWQSKTYRIYEKQIG